MADVQDANASAEPSMEEILASIRRIIADEKTPAAEAESPATEDVLELTQMVQDDGSVVDVSVPEPEPVVEEAAPPEPEPVPEPAPEPEPFPPPPPPEPPVYDEGDGLLSNRSADAAASALASLVSTVQQERRASMPSYTPVGNGGRSLEDMVLELMRPMLKAWLDENLPAVVDRLVQKEVERIVKKLGD